MRLAATLALPLVLGGCVTAGEYAVKNADFPWSRRQRPKPPQADRVVQNQEQPIRLQAGEGADGEEVDRRRDGSPVALLNNKGLQAA